MMEHMTALSGRYVKMAVQGFTEHTRQVLSNRLLKLLESDRYIVKNAVINISYKLIEYNFNAQKNTSEANIKNELLLKEIAELIQQHQLSLSIDELKNFAIGDSHNVPLCGHDYAKLPEYFIDMLRGNPVIYQIILLKILGNSANSMRDYIDNLFGTNCHPLKNFVNADLKGLDLIGLDLSNADLSGANLSRARLIGADLSSANLRGANLSYTDLTQTNLSGTQLSNVNLYFACLLGTNFSDSVLNNVGILLKLPVRLDLSKLDAYYNHTNRSFGSLLTAIESIDDRHRDLKIDMIKQVISHVKDIDISTVLSSFEEVLYNNPLYREDKDICKFIIERLLNKKIVSSKIEMVNFNPNEIKCLLSYIYDYELNEQKRSSFMLEHNALINQIIYYGRTTRDDEELRVGVEHLETRYLELEPIRAIKLELELDEYGNFNESNTLIFISEDLTQKLVVSNEYYEHFVLNKTNDTKVGDAFWFSDKDGQKNIYKPIKNPPALAKTFSLFDKGYMFDENTTESSLTEFIILDKEGEEVTV